MSTDFLKNPLSLFDIRGKTADCGRDRCAGVPTSKLAMIFRF